MPTASQPGEKFTRDERNILAQSLDFEQMTVSDLMRPLNEVVALYASETLEQNLETVLRNRFSRYPYFDTNEDDVLGVVHLKDRIERILGEQGLQIVSRLMGLFVCALAAQIIFTGIRGYLVS